MWYGGNWNVLINATFTEIGIGGTLSDAARVLIIKESDWSIESNTNEGSGSYTVSTEAGAKLVIARKADGEVSAYGNIIPI